MMPPVPPRRLERILGLLVGRDAREGVLGDLAEEYADVARRHGVPAARRWYGRQAAGIAAHLMAARVRWPLRRRPVAVSEPPVASGRWHLDLAHDLRDAWRSLSRQPGVSLAIVGALALGLAANAAIFALGDAIVLRPFRFAGVDRTIVVASSPEHGFLNRDSVAPSDFLEWRDTASDVFERFAAVEWWDVAMSGTGLPEQVAGFRVSADFFEIMQPPPPRGRWFAATDEVPGTDRQAVISHGLWIRRFGADDRVLGRKVLFDGVPHEIVGVAPAAFSMPWGAEVWAPLAIPPEARLDRGPGSLIVLGRLRPGVSLAAASARMHAIVERQRRAYPETHAERPLAVRSFMSGFGDPGAGPFLAVWQVAALVLLLIGCANAANLLLARGSERQREFAVRLALGSGRLRIACQLAVEAVLLAGFAALVAIPLAWGALGAMRGMFPPAIIRFVPGWEHLHIAPRTFLVTALLAGAAAVASALVPAIHSSRSAIVDDLRQGGRHGGGRARQRVRFSLAAAQIALTIALLTAAALTTSALQRVTSGPLGFDPEGVLTARAVLREAAYERAEDRVAFVERLLERLRAIPAVNAAAVSNVLPYSGSNTSGSFWPEGRSTHDPSEGAVDLRRVTPEWQEVLKVPLLRGRGLGERDRAGAQPVAVVSASLASRYWPGTDAVGRRFRLEPDGPWITVVGVVGDVAHYWIATGSQATAYMPLAQLPPRSIHVSVRMAGDPAALGMTLRAAVAAVDPDQPITLVRSYEGMITDTTSGLRFAARTLAAMALVALVLAVMGVYSLMAYVTSRRTQEIGLRMALGASRRHVIRLTVGLAGRIAAAGVLAGIVLSLAIGRTLEGALFGVVAGSLGLTLAVGALLTVVALLASYAPAVRAAGVDPLVALRQE